MPSHLPHVFSKRGQRFSMTVQTTTETIGVLEISSVVGGGAKTSNPRQHVCRQGLQQGIHTAGVRFTGVPLLEGGFANFMRS